MEQKNPREIRAALAQPFAPEDLEWRLQVTSKDKTRGLAVPYVTNRAIQTRLDDVVGPENWYNDFKPWHGAGKKQAQLCGIAIYFEGRGFITKWDGAEDSDIEAVKGGLSDSMKRAAVQWGVGRVLYSMDTVWVDIEPRGDSYVIRDSERPKLDEAYLSTLKRLQLTPAAPGGAQAQLTPTTPRQSTPASQPSAPVKPPESQNTVAPSAPAGKTTEFPHKTEPEYEYIVESAQVQNGMNSKSTTVMLKGRDGKVTKAFARGAHEDLTPGTLLVQVKLSLKKQNTVVFNFLESYEIAAPVEQAA
ncbi:MAG: Rad52/Rad22 family DNA repair protein [Faecousia sp.]